MFDARPTGVARYIRRLIEALEHLPNAPKLRYFARPGRTRLVRDMAPPLGDRRIERLLWPLGLDVFHAPDVRVPYVNRAPVVVTIHDLSAIERTDHATTRFLLRKQSAYRHAARVAARLITHTETVRRDISTRLGFTLDRIDAIPLAAGLEFDASSASPAVALRPLPGELLTIGGPSRRKDSAILGDLLRRWRLVHGWRPNVTWVGSGAADELAAVLERVDNEDRGRIHSRGHVSDTQLVELFAATDGLLSLSTTEGFGLPLVEAAQRGVPVLARESPILREVLGDGAFWLESGSPNAGDVIREFLRADARERVVAAALQRVRGYSWHETARRTLVVYERACAD
ncbi:MAG: glycosyltransferase [Planctomycetota bacterium]